MSEFKLFSAPRAGRGRLWRFAMVALVSGFFGTGLQLLAPHSAEANLMKMGKVKDVADAETRSMLFAWQLGSSVNADAEQKRKVIAIAKGAASDIFPLVEKMKVNIRQALNLFRAETIDEAAVEKLRGEQVGIVETISKRKTKAMLEIFGVFNVDQRKHLVDAFEDVIMGKKKWRELMEDLDNL